MAQVTRKQAFVAMDGHSSVTVSDSDWTRIEAASGYLLPAPLRETIRDITEEFLDYAIFERDTPPVELAEHKVKSIKAAADKLREVIGWHHNTLERDRDKPAKYSDFYARNLISHHARLPFQHGRDALHNLALVLQRVSKGCELTLAAFEKDRVQIPKPRNFRTGEAWEWWVRKLTTIMKTERLRTGVRKDAEKPSPFAAFIREMQKCVPFDLRCSTHSSAALAQAICKARSGAKTSPAGSE